MKLATLLDMARGRPAILCAEIYAEIAADHLEELIPLALAEDDARVQLEGDLEDALHDVTELEREVRDLRHERDQLRLQEQLRERAASAIASTGGIAP